jgi:hypothetical protein
MVGDVDVFGTRVKLGVMGDRDRRLIVSENG